MKIICLREKLLKFTIKQSLRFIMHKRYKIRDSLYGQNIILVSRGVFGLYEVNQGIHNCVVRTSGTMSQSA